MSAAPAATPLSRSARPAGYREEVLDEIPSLRRLYLRAAGGARRHVLARGALGRATLPAVSLRVDGVRADPDRLTAYQHLLGEPGTDVLPAGFVHVVGFPLATSLLVRPDFPLPAIGLVHVTNRVEQLRPVHLDDRLTVRAWVPRARTHRRGVVVDVVTEVAAEGTEEVLWRGTSGYLAQGRPPAGLVLEGDDDGRDGGERPDERPTDTPAGPPTALWRLGPDTGRRYADVSGDVNPIHVSRLGARAFGFRRPIAHGMYTSARALGATDHGGSFVWTATFGKPVLLPTTVALTLDGGRYRVWSPGSGRTHLSGEVSPLA